MKAPFDIAADLDTPVSAFLKLAPLRPRFLLESVIRGERLGRYSFVGFGEGTEIRFDEDGWHVDGATTPAPSGRDAVLGALRAALAEAPRPGPADGVPFRGGLVGFSSYDLVRHFERLPSRAAARPGEPLGAWFAPRSLLVFDHLTRRAAVLHDGDEAERAQVRREVLDCLRHRMPAPARPGRHEPATGSMDRAAYEEAVRTVQRHIHAGDVYQLVPSIRMEGRCDLDPFEVYRALRLLNPSPYMYFLDVGGMQVVGSSPEALVTLQGRSAKLRPIAGTRPRGADEALDQALADELLADPKEIAEHVMLVDLARNDLGRVAVAGSVRVEPYQVIERYSHVMHIVSGVEGVLAPELDAFDLFAATFPAGTVVGAPKIRAMEIIDAIEPVRRGIYAGTVGYFGFDGLDQAIAIRTLVFRDGVYAYQAGAGVVADSVPAKEYDEVRAKVGALEAALRLAEAGL